MYVKVARLLFDFYLKIYNLYSPYRRSTIKYRAVKAYLAVSGLVKYCCSPSPVTDLLLSVMFTMPLHNAKIVYSVIFYQHGSYHFLSIVFAVTLSETST